MEVKSKVNFGIFTLLLFIALLLPGCGGDDDDDNDSALYDDDDDSVADDDDSSDEDDDSDDDDDATDDDDDVVTDDDDDTDDDDIDDPAPDYDMDFEGFGADVIGGDGGEVVTVTSLDDDGPGSLRQILTNVTGPTIVLFDVDGFIDLQSGVDIPSDITLDARGRDVTITTNGFRIWSQSNIIIMNLAFVDIGGIVSSDAIQIAFDSSDIVIFHCLFDNDGLQPFVEDLPDEQISAVFGSRNITISWCKFLNHDKTLLFGNGDAPISQDSNITVTLHHNRFIYTGRRHPFLRAGKVDMYNNWIGPIRKYLETPYGSRCQEEGQLLIEANFYDYDMPLYFVGSYFKTGGKIRALDNLTSHEWVLLLESKPEEVFDRPYEANIQPITDAWKQMMTDHTGNTMPPI